MDATSLKITLNETYARVKYIEESAKLSEQLIDVFISKNIKSFRSIHVREMISLNNQLSILTRTCFDHLQSIGKDIDNEKERNQYCSASLSLLRSLNILNTNFHKISLYCKTFKKHKD